ncbi:MAG TPA: hypothetical protein VLZ89_03335 [Anaerolineales bacterium]|nr:hypothetical protein [Anaerolineales bacterium]
MSTKLLLRSFFMASVVGTIALLLVGVVPARAQCGNPPPSSCTTCHAQEDPVADQGAWHSVHAHQDICINCHGGNGSTMDESLAHAGMNAQPLSDIYTDCHSCHPDYVDRAAPYAATLQVTPSSCATPTSAVLGSASNGLPPSRMVMPADLASTSAAPQIFLFVAGGLTLLVLFCIGACWLGEHPLKN